MQKPSVFLDSRRYGSDCCAQEAKDAQNSAIFGYTSFQYLPADCQKPHMRSPDFQYEHPNLRAKIGYGVADDCAVDSYSSLRNDPNQMTRDRCKVQLFERIFQGVPNLKPGVPAPEKEMPIQQGISNTNLEGIQIPCKKTIMEQTTNKPIPLLDCMKDIQTAESTVEPWIRGGDNTRDFVRRQKFLEQCGRQFSGIGNGTARLL